MDIGCILETLGWDFTLGEGLNGIVASVLTGNALGEAPEFVGRELSSILFVLFTL